MKNAVTMSSDYAALAAENANLKAEIARLKNPPNDLERIWPTQHDSQFKVGDWVKHLSGEFAKVALVKADHLGLDFVVAAGSGAALIPKKHCIRQRVRPFESAEEFWPFRDRWMKHGDQITRVLYFSDRGTDSDLEWGELLDETFYAPGEPYHGLPVGVMEDAQ